MKTHRLAAADLLADRVLVELDALTIGVYDGLHRGHRRLIEELARRSGPERSGLICFSRHPRAALGREEPLRLVDAPHRAMILASWGLGHLIELETDAALLGIEAEAFCDGLRRVLPFRTLVVGPDFRFGRGARGSNALLRERFGEAVVVMEPIRDGDVVISSTLLRDLLQRGELHRANRYLGRRFAVFGRVISGDGIGRTLGFPTLNIDPPPVALPDGVYAVATSLGNGVAHLGPRPTLDRMERRFEVHLFDPPVSLAAPAADVEIAFERRLRGIERYDSPEKLRFAVEADIRRARELFDGTA